MAARDAIEKKLTKLRRLVQQEKDGKPVAFHDVPAELARVGAKQVVFTAAEKRDMQTLQEELSADLRFEHLENGGWAQLVDIVTRVQLEPEVDHVAKFMEQNARTPEERLLFPGRVSYCQRQH